jgi:hypothetical protein
MKIDVELLIVVMLSLLLPLIVLLVSGLLVSP